MKKPVTHTDTAADVMALWHALDTVRAAAIATMAQVGETVIWNKERFRAAMQSMNDAVEHAQDLAAMVANCDECGACVRENGSSVQHEECCSLFPK